MNRINSIFVHWSESDHINNAIGYNHHGDIDSSVNVDRFNEIVKEASLKVRTGYDKTVLTVRFNDGITWHSVKFCLTDKTDSLLKLIGMAK